MHDNFCCLYYRFMLSVHPRLPKASWQWIHLTQAVPDWSTLFPAPEVPTPPSPLLTQQIPSFPCPEKKGVPTPGWLTLKHVPSLSLTPSGSSEDGITIVLPVLTFSSVLYIHDFFSWIFSWIFSCILVLSFMLFPFDFQVSPSLPILKTTCPLDNSHLWFSEPRCPLKFKFLFPSLSSVLTS